MSKKKNNYYLGVDIGSISVKTVVIDDAEQVLYKSYERSDGQPIKILKARLAQIKPEYIDNIKAVGITGSGRNLAKVYIGGDQVIDEITTQSTAVLHKYPEVKTIIEIGGQDSKIIQLKDGVVRNFAMNTVCAAGTGAFLDQQAARLKIDIKDFGEIALRAKEPTLIAGRCTVFAETDMIHKQQIGIPVEDILAGLCNSLAKNFVHAVAKNLEIKKPVIFQGGVAANKAMIQAFNSFLDTEVIIPEDYNVMPALGSALIAKERQKGPTEFKGHDFIDQEIVRKVWHCTDCGNNCELIDVIVAGKKLSTTGSLCGKYN